MSFDVHSYLNDFHTAATAAGFSHEAIACIEGYEIPTYTKTASNAKRVYLSSGCHGDEPSGPYALLEMLKEGFFGEDMEWLICPMINPTGMAAGTRENAQGIDLNRDYFKKTTEETNAHAEWLLRQQVPDIFLSLHEDWESTGFYLYEIQKNVCKSIAETILKTTSTVIPVEPNRTIDDHNVHELGWIFHPPQADYSDQWPEAIFMAELGTEVSYTLETPSSLELEKRIQCHKLAVKCAIQELLLTPRR